MSDPFETPPPAPPQRPTRPFAGEPRAVKAGGGCGRPALIGCGILVVLLGIAAIVFVAKAKDLLGWTMKQLQSQVMAQLPDDVTSAERTRLDRGFEAALAKIEAGEVQPPALAALQKQLMNAAQKSQAKTLTRDDVLDLLSALERVGGLLPPDGPAPDDGPADEPSGPADGSTSS